MKKKETKNVRTGILVTASILLLMAGLYYVSKKQQLFNTTFKISAIFKDVVGLQVGNNVRFSGINIGVVEDIEIASDSTVKVDMIIEESSRKFIKKDAKAVIGSDGLIGNTILTILPGPAGKTVIENNDYIATKDPVSIDNILFKLKATGENAVNISDNLADLMSNLKEGKGTVGKLLMDPEFATTIDKTVVNLKEGTGGFKKNMEAAKHSFLLKGFFKDKKTRKEKRQERREKRQERKAKRKEAKEKQS
jgi:phospholipid/cholesterol/gamma-HCH transport system substrate-binding protein